MASIQQIIAEIQLAADLPPSHKTKVVQIIRDAEQRLRLKIMRAPRKITNAKNLVTLPEWEAAQGVRLNSSMMAQMARHNDLCQVMISDLIEEFRGEMFAKGKQYADFRMAFMTYLRKGYLSKTMGACTRALSPYSQKTIINNKGVNL